MTAIIFSAIQQATYYEGGVVLIQASYSWIRFYTFRLCFIEFIWDSNFNPKFGDYCASFAGCWLSLGIYLYMQFYTFDVGSNFKYFGCCCYVTMFYRSNCPTLYAN